MTILQQMRGFTKRYGRTIQSDDVLWRYYRLGTGTPPLVDCAEQGWGAPS
jgi:hypothetical protein